MRGTCCGLVVVLAWVGVACTSGSDEPSGPASSVGAGGSGGALDAGTGGAANAGGGGGQSAANAGGQGAANAGGRSGQGGAVGQAAGGSAQAGGAAQPCQSADCTSTAGADVVVATKSSTRAIHPEIYGLAFATKAQMADLNVPLNRSGGNSTTRYNWKLDVHNVGADWYYENVADVGEGTYGTASYLSSSDVFIRDTLAAGAAPLVTIPTIGFTPKARKTDHPYDCGFPITKYPDQCCGSQGAVDPWDSNCGSGKTSQGSIVATAEDALNTSVASGPEDATARVKHIMDQYGSAYGTKPHYFQLDNEMLAWSGTHGDVHPSHTTYDEVWQKTLDYAPAIRASDPKAFIMGYGTFSTGDVLDSMVEGDRGKHNNVPLMRWYLQKLAAYAAQNGGTRLVDCVDVHPYPQQGTPPLDSPRSLWDASYTDPTWINDMYAEPVRLLPRLREWIQADYPGTEICLTEYTFFPEDANAALIQADVLGIYGREGVRLAAYWTVPWTDDTAPAPTAPYWAFRMYRNYDGSGGQFGDQSLAVTTALADLSAFAARRSSDQAFTVMLINKANASRQITVGLDGATAREVGVFTYTVGAKAIQTGATLTPNAAKVTTSVPGHAVQLLIAK